MNGGNPPSMELRSNRHSTRRPRVFQFSLTSLIVTVTVMALILSAYFSVGRLIGMSTTEVLTQGLGWLLFDLPLLLVWIVGLTIAIRRLKHTRLPATLTMIALGGLILSTFILQVVQMALIHLVTSGQVSPEIMSWSLAVVGILYAVLNTACWILILAAVFVRRPPDLPEIERADPGGTLFLANEP